MNKPFCLRPWQILFLTQQGTHGPCCHLTTYAHKVRFPSSREELLDIFNSPSIVALREALLSGSLEGTPCADCFSAANPALGKELGTLAWNPDPAMRQRIMEHIAGDKAVVDYLPSMLTVYTSSACNLCCKMCIMSPYHRHIATPYPVDALIRLFDDIDLNTLDLFAICGGEVLLTKDGRRLIDYVWEKKPERPVFYVTTNGSRLKPWLEKLAEIPKLGFVCSLEGYGKSYEHIRAGADWKSVTSNLLQLAKLRTGKPGLMEIQSLVMRSSLEDMPRLLETLLPSATKFTFLQIAGDYLLENIFLYPSLLRSVAWREGLQETASYARSAGRDAEAEQAEAFLLQLEELFQRPDAETLRRERRRLYSLATLCVEAWQLCGRNRHDPPQYGEIAACIEDGAAWLETLGALSAQAAGTLRAIAAKYASHGDVPLALGLGAHGVLHRWAGRRLVLWMSPTQYRERFAPYFKDRGVTQPVGHLGDPEWNEELGLPAMPRTIDSLETIEGVVLGIADPRQFADLCRLSKNPFPVLAGDGFLMEARPELAVLWEMLQEPFVSSSLEHHADA